MTSDLTAPPRREFQSFHDFPIVTDLDNLDADIAILGIPFGDPYSMSEETHDAYEASWLVIIAIHVIICMLVILITVVILMRVITSIGIIHCHHCHPCHLHRTYRYHHCH